SGNGRHLTNKGGVPLGVGINGLASTAAVFAGSRAQAAYVADTGVSDPFRMRFGSWGFWMRSPKRGLGVDLFSKYSQVVATSSFVFETDTSNLLHLFIYDGAANVQIVSKSDLFDDKWHFVV